jgi:GNAT superfamily N-acetyltransferase
MKIIEVVNQSQQKEFLLLSVRLYQDDPYWIRPLDSDIEKVFDKEKNKFFTHGKAIRWLLEDDKGQIIGRVAAFINERTILKDNEQPTGGMGFFECINSQEAAFKLFDTCKEWLTAQGMEAMDGPINFGERDNWWGLLVEGFDEPNYGMNYNFPYYKDFFESYGFQPYFNQYTYRRIIHEPVVPLVEHRANKIFQDKNYSFEHLQMNNLEKYAEDFRTIYNKAWVKHSGVKEMLKEQAMNIIKQMKPVLDEKIVFFAYYKGEPVAFYIQILDMNQALRYMNGKTDLIGKLKYLWVRYIKGFTRIIGVVFGVVPEHQGKGVEMAIVKTYANYAHVPNYKYKIMDMKWIGDFNPKMMRVAEHVGGQIHRKHITYRKLFDETKPFKRSTVIA